MCTSFSLFGAFIYLKARGDIQNIHGIQLLYQIISNDPKASIQNEEAKNILRTSNIFCNSSLRFPKIRLSLIVIGGCISLISTKHS